MWKWTLSWIQAKSVHDMLEEARKIVSPGAPPVHKMKKTTRKKDTKKDGKKAKGVHLIFKMLSVI